ncbi:DNA methyltransferase [Agrobacterium vitis]|uniref:DNA methyltransferase n=1 Tax=Agrobacterium vitis TaxID=373 RepID=UPI001573801B|nr:DNA methyltransferase [Agrobacterium vitis]NSZ48435.1 DNA methyltransferase [Agrobacterium vitis]UJL73031.1 DNA methyltransferase [Agrobacterium vitis]
MATGSLYRDFIYPPFSVFDARAGWWQTRKRAWLELGIQSERGRAANLLSGYANAMATFNKQKGNDGPVGDWASKSVFDPVLCELAYAWFSPSRGTILDPFAGGSVRGIVAALMGRNYVGIDLRAEQVEENDLQALQICPNQRPRWITGDAVHLRRLWRGRADFIFTCPPYGDLERYSNDPSDLSNMHYDVFLGSFRAVVKQAARQLLDNRFAAFVVGDFRDKNGIYRGFVNDTVNACKDAGLLFYNDAVLVTAGGSLPMRTRGSFEASRKLGKGHQNVLIFVKGDPAMARKELGNVEPCVAITTA